MKTARERAMDIVYEISGRGFARATLEAMAADPSAACASLRKMIATIERGIEADRKALVATRAPS